MKSESFKLYYTSTSCGAANYIAAKLAGLTFDSETVDIRSHKTASGADFYGINPKGNVPAIVFPDGTVLSENVATLGYIASQADADSELSAPPAYGTKEYFAFIDKLAYVNTEIHKACGPLFYGGMDEAATAKAKARALEKFEYFTSKILAGNKFVFGDKPSVVDIYAYIVFSWSGYLGIDIASNKAAVEFSDRVKALPTVAKAHEEMNAAPTST